MDYEKAVLMAPEEMLGHFTRLRDELAQAPNNHDWAVQWMMVNLMLEAYQFEPKYEWLRRNGGPRIEVLELHRPLTERDLANIEECACIKRHVRKSLRELKAEKPQANEAGGQRVTRPRVQCPKRTVKGPSSGRSR